MQKQVWESPTNGDLGDAQDAQTLLLTGNTETVYGFCAIDLKHDGPVVVEVPAKMLGGVSDLWQCEIMDIGLTGVDKGKGGRLLLLPPDYTGSVPEGYLARKASTYCAVLGVRGFQVDGKPVQAVALMKREDLSALRWRPACRR